MVTIAFTHEKRENKMKLVDKVGFESIDLLHCGLTVFWIVLESHTHTHAHTESEGSEEFKIVRGRKKCIRLRADCIFFHKSVVLHYPVSVRV